MISHNQGLQFYRGTSLVQAVFTGVTAYRHADQSKPDDTSSQDLSPNLGPPPANNIYFTYILA